MSATLDSAEFILIDNWPEVGNADWAGPPGINDLPSQAHHNSDTESYHLGTKFRVYQEGGTGMNTGWATFIYLKMGTAAATALAAKHIVCGEAPPTSTGARELLYTVTNNDATADLNAGLCAISISAVTNSYYGWFWCGGICPDSIVSALAGNYYTQGSAVIGGMCLGQADADNAVIGFITDPANAAIMRVAICLPATDVA